MKVEIKIENLTEEEAAIMAEEIERIVKEHGCKLESLEINPREEGAK